MSIPTIYSMGFVFSEDGHRVLLIEKNRPDFLRGKWTGVGGHVEPGETPLAAVAREVEEESGLVLPESDWAPAGVFTDGSSYVIHAFAGRADLATARSVTEERVAAQPLADLHALPQGPRLDEYLAAALQALEAVNPSDAPGASRRRPAA